MQNKLNKIADDTNLFLKNFIKKQKKNRINSSYEIWLVSWWKKNQI